MADALFAEEFAGYRIDGRVGRGGMGVVYRATDLSLDRTVALKVLDDELAKDPTFRRRFVTESKLAASLDHPNVIPIYAAGEHDGMPYIAMRFVAGEDLRGVLRTEGRLEPGRVARLVAQLASALDAAHEAGLVHRDVKPANVLVTKADHVYLTDFGLTKRVAADTEATRTGVVLGTLNYMAPEQIRGQAIGPFTDVYSLGCMIVHLLTGQVPFPVETEEAKLWAHVAEPPPRPSERVQGLGNRVRPGRRARARQAPRGPLRQRRRARVRAGRGAPAGARPPRRRYAEAAPAAGAQAGAGAQAPVAPARRDVLRAAAQEPFNMAVLAVLLVAAIALGQVALGVPLALAVYAAAVLRSFFDPDTARRVQRG